MSVTGAGIVVQVRRLPECPHAERVRELVARAAARAGVAVEVQELIGEYPSPTVVVGGRDVTGEPLRDGVSCRLDLPSERQIRAALQDRSRGLT